MLYTSRPMSRHKLRRVESWHNVFLIWVVSLSLTEYMYFLTSTLGYFPPLIYLRNSRLGCLLFYGCILTFLESTSMPCINFISSLTTLPNAIQLLSFFEMDRVTRHIFSVWLLVPCRPVLLEPLEVLSGVVWRDRMHNKLWGGSATASLNKVFLCSVNFFLVGLELLTWGWIVWLYLYQFSVLFRILLPLWWTYSWFMNRGS